jgi:hypothetical protein
MSLDVFQRGNSLIVHAATWDINPAVTRETFADDFRKNPYRAERDYAANPPKSIQSALYDPDIVLRNVNTHRKNPVTDDESYESWFEGSAGFEYYMHIDLAKVKDSIGIAMCHLDSDTGMVVVDLIQNFDPRENWELSFEKVYQLVLTVKAKGFNFAKVTLDSWNSVYLIERLNNSGIPAEVYSVDRTSEAYDTLIEALVSGRLDYYKQDRFIDELSHLRLYKGNKYDHDSSHSKDVSDAVAGCVSQCVKARIGLSLKDAEVVNSVSEEPNVITLTENVFTTGGNYFTVSSVAVVPHIERSRKRLGMVYGFDEQIVLGWGWHDKEKDLLKLEHYAVWQGFLTQESMKAFEDCVMAVSNTIPFGGFVLNDGVPIEIVTFLQQAGHKISSPLSQRVPGSLMTKTTIRPSAVNNSIVRMGLMNLKRGNLLIPNVPLLIKDLKFVTDDNLLNRPYVMAMALWADFAARESSFGRNAQGMPRSTGAMGLNMVAASLKAGQNQRNSSMGAMADKMGGESDIRRIRERYNASYGGSLPTIRKQNDPNIKTLPRITKLR